jgi:N-formylmaleamate deformylase
MRHLSILLLMLLTSCARAAMTPTPNAPARPSHVSVVGEGPPILLIPGLSSPADVWADVAEHYQAHYQCHVLSLAGFGGVPAFDGPPLPAVRDALAA